LCSLPSLKPPRGTPGKSSSKDTPQDQLPDTFISPRAEHRRLGTQRSPLSGKWKPLSLSPGTSLFLVSPLQGDPEILNGSQSPFPSSQKPFPSLSSFQQGDRTRANFTWANLGGGGGGFSCTSSSELGKYLDDPGCQEESRVHIYSSTLK
jgi:hypothetical protein